MAPTRTSTRVTLANIRKSNSISVENSIVGKSTFAKRKAENSPPKGNTLKKPAFNDVENENYKSALKTISENQLNIPLTRAKSCKLPTARAPLGALPTNAVGIKLTNVKNISSAKPKTTSVKVKETKTDESAAQSEKHVEEKPNVPLTRAKASKITVTKSHVVKSVKPEKPNLKPAVPTKSKSITTVPEVKAVEKTVDYVGAVLEKKSDDENVPPVEKERPVTRLSARLSLRKSLSTEKSAESSSLYISALEEITNTSIKEKNVKDEPPLSEFDKELLHDPHQVSLYAMEIFEYLKSREANFVVDDYMVRQRHISENMRAVLIDWMVEVQESFELNHETLYLAVKIVDSYLSKVEIRKENLQLVGAAALFLSCKYDERMSPLLDEFVYLCDNAYTQQDLLAMEQSILSHINFELSFPISYSFLRRYARCARIQMPLLTLARYILELSLMDYRTVTLSESKQAAAALYLAFRMVKYGDWNDKLIYYTGYKKSDFKDIVLLFNNILHKKFNDQLKNIKTKYSHELFFHVAKTPLIKDKDLNLDE